MKAIKKIDGKMAKMRYSVENSLTNPSTKLFCDKCHSRIGIVCMLRKSIRVKKNTTYKVICKSCGEVNIRLKGAVGEEIDKTWDKYGF